MATNFIQEIFDKSAHLLLTQKRKCMVNNEPRYKWRGRKCPAFLFIHDYKKAYEGLSVRGLEEKYKVFSNCGYIEEEISFIFRMQILHDSVAVCNWKKTLIKLAKNFNLNTEVIYND